MSVSSHADEVESVNVVLEVQSIQSTDDPPMEEWSSINLEQPELGPKRRAYKEGLYDPGRPEICTKYIALSDSSVFKHPYYTYRPVTDPGIEKALLEREEPVIYPDNGQELYLALCKEMKQAPVRIFYNSLCDEKINLNYYCASPPGIRPMSMALQYNRNVKILDLTDSFLNNDACFHLGDMLIKNSTLEELNLSGCRIGSGGVKCLCAGLLVNRTLYSLNLNKNQLEDAGGENMAAAVMRGIGVKELHLSYNSLGSKAAAALADALEFYNDFVYLDLSWNNFFSPLGTCNLFTRLGESRTLKGINLSWCSLTGPRVGVALKNLSQARSLNHLDLSYNKLSGEAIASIIEKLGNAKKLHTLNLSNNPMDKNDALNVLSKLKYFSVKIQNLYLDNITVDGEFVDLLEKIKQLKSRRNAVITHGDVTGTYKAKGRDPRELLLDRADFLCSKRKKNKVDFALVIMQLVKNKHDVMEAKEFIAAVQNADAPLDEDLLDQMVNVFAGSANRKSKTINLVLLEDYIKRKWSDRKLPPTPPSEPEPLSVLQGKLEPRKGKDKTKTKK